MSFWRAMARGFTLIEMAIVLVVIGLILSGGLMAIGPVLEGTKATETNARLDVIEKALVLYVIQNGCLPCPAGTAAPLTGQALNDTAAYTSGCSDDTGSTCAAAGGVVPWATLGLSINDATDGWGRVITYVVSPNRTLTDSSMDRSGSTYPSGDRVVWDADPDTDTNQTDSGLTAIAAYVLISHGRDGHGGLTTAGTTITDPSAGANIVQVDNATRTCDATTPCHQDDIYGIDDANKFDDVVRWRTAPLIIQQCGDNACGNPA